MAAVSLGEFIRVNRQEVILRCRRRATLVANWPSSEADVERGIPLFLDQLMVELGHESSQTRAIRKTATEHGQDLFFQGFTVAQVVHDYGNVCQTVTDLATEQAIPISTDDFRTLNRCLDDAIAGAVTEYTRQQALVDDGQSHELRTLISAAITGFEVLQTGSVGVTGTTGALVHRTLLDIRTRFDGSPLRLVIDQS
jgi:hypothetical protein